MSDAIKKWYAIYVRSRSEKKAYKSLIDLGTEVYLPLIVTIKQWSDRKKKVEEPLFKSYVFVHTDLRNYYDILNCDNVVKFITFEGQPVPIPDNQILAVKSYINENDITEISEGDFHEGELVRVKSGELKGLVGRLTSIRGKTRLIVLIEVVNKYIPINIPRSNVEHF